MRALLILNLAAVEYVKPFIFITFLVFLLALLEYILFSFFFFFAFPLGYIGGLKLRWCLETHFKKIQRECLFKRGQVQHILTMAKFEIKTFPIYSLSILNI